jgi:hypothetical protein
MQAGEQDSALHLGARHGRLVGNPMQRPAGDRERRPVVRRGDPCAHPGQRLDDAAHRPALQRLVSADDSRERVAGKDAGYEPQRCP